MSVTNSRTVGTQVPKRRYRSPELSPRVPNRRGPELSRSRNVGNSFQLMNKPTKQDLLYQCSDQYLYCLNVELAF